MPSIFDKISGQIFQSRKKKKKKMKKKNINQILSLVCTLWSERNLCEYKVAKICLCPHRKGCVFVCENPSIWEFEGEKLDGWNA